MRILEILCLSLDGYKFEDSDNSSLSDLIFYMNGNLPWSKNVNSHPTYVKLEMKA